MGTQYFSPIRVPPVLAGVSYIVIVFGYCPEVRAKRHEKKGRNGVVLS
jgi:hypothetical protein